MRRNYSQGRRPRRFVVWSIVACSLALPAMAQTSPSITIDPECGPETTGQSDEPHYEITVEGSGFNAGDDVEINFAGERQDDPGQQDVVADENGAFSAIIRPVRRSSGSYEVEALQRNEEDGTISARAAAPFAVPCPEPGPSPEPSSVEPTPSPDPSPTREPERDKDKEPKKDRRRFKPHLVFEPAVGPPGSVAEVSGRGFPARTDVALEWDEGVGSFEVRTNGKGRFSVGVLIFPNDVIGPRRLVVTGPRFRTARVLFVVVPSTAAPPDFVNR